MTAIQRQRVVWTGFPGGPGVSTFYFTNAASAQSAVTALFASLANFYPGDVTTHVEPGGDILEDTSGTLTGVWAGTLQTDTKGVDSAASYSAASGALLRWETATIRNGSRLRGRTFVVPCTVSAYQNDGSLSTAAKGLLEGYCNTFVAAVTPNMVVWQRPRTATVAYVDGKGIPRKGLPARLGSSAVVVASSVPDLSVILRTRRD